MKWAVIETTEHIVEADTREEAEETYLHYGPDKGREPMVRFTSVLERDIQEAIENA